jgi:hypothetical protein
MVKLYQLWWSLNKTLGLGQDIIVSNLIWVANQVDLAIGGVYFVICSEFCWLLHCDKYTNVNQKESNTSYLYSTYWIWRFSITLEREYLFLPLYPYSFWKKCVWRIAHLHSFIDIISFWGSPEKKKGKRKERKEKRNKKNKGCSYCFR